MSTPQPDYLVGKFYTSARKFKQLIGQLPDGTMIPGGPYTLTQFVPALIIIVLFGIKIWIFGLGSFTSLLIQSIIVITISAVTVIGLGKLPPTRRSIFHLASTTPALIYSDPNGYWVGKPIEKNKHSSDALLKALPALLIVTLFIGKLAIVGVSNWIALLLQITLVLILATLATTWMTRVSNNKEETPSEDTTAYQASESEIHKVTTTKTVERPASGFSRFQKSIK